MSKAYIVVRVAEKYPGLLEMIEIGDFHLEEKGHVLTDPSDVTQQMLQEYISQAYHIDTTNQHEGNNTEQINHPPHGYDFRKEVLSW